ncbi:MAG: ABC transporter ATP-binding protein [Acidobacteriota bacterium]
MAESLIELTDVRKTFGRTTAVDRLSLTVNRGEMVGVIGPDGAGKTTTLRMICGLIAPDAGVIRVFGVDPFRVRRTATASIGYLSQRFSLYGDLSIDENIAFFARIHGVWDFDARRQRLLELTGLRQFRERLADRLSGGMKQKLALACTLVHEPPVLVLDEPTTGVDPVSRREFWKLLAEFQAQGLTMIMATPYLDEAERCTRVALLHEGRLLAQDQPSRLQAQTEGKMAEVVVDRPRDALQALRGHMDPDRVQLFGDRLHVRLDPNDSVEALGARLADIGVAATAIRAIAPTLEDVFIERLGRSGRGAQVVTNPE